MIKVVKWYSAVVVTLSYLYILVVSPQYIDETAAQATESNFLALVLSLPVVVFLWWVAFNKEVK